MKKILQKGIRVFLSASLTAGLLAGCGGGGGEQSSSSAAEGGDSVPTFTIATMRWSDAWPTDFLESGIMKELEEKHGINIEWEIYYASDWSEQKSLLLASGDLPDAFLGSNALTASDMAQNKGNFVELTDLITEETMPNLTALFDAQAGCGIDLITGDSVDFGGGLTIQGKTAMIIRTEEVSLP